MSSAAAKVVTLGPGSAPHVTVDGQGNAQIAYTHGQSPTDVLHYCQLAPGAKNCAKSATFAYPPSSIDVSGGWAFAATGGRTLVLDSRCCNHYDDRYLYTSLNGGAFSGPVQIGSEDTLGGGVGGEALYAPAGTLAGVELILAINDLQTEGATFQATRTVGPANAEAFSMSGGDSTTSADIAWSGNTLRAVYTDFDRGNKVFFRDWNGTSDIDNPLSWNQPLELPHAKSDIYSTSEIASGGGNFFYAYARGKPGHEHWYLSCSCSGAPEVRVSGQTTGEATLATDPSNRAYVAWIDAAGRLRLRWTKKPDRLKLADPITLAKDIPGAGASQLDMEVGKKGRGWITVRGGDKVRALTFKR